MTVVLVSCGKAKRSASSAAQDIYTSPLFRASWSWAERSGLDHRVISAKHGILAGEDVIDPYDTYLGSLSRVDLVSLKDRVELQLRDFGTNDDLVVLGGRGYVDLVRDAVTNERRVFDPLKGLNIGNRINWLKESSTTDSQSGLLLEQFYEQLRLLNGDDLISSKLPRLEDLLGGRSIPPRGLYFFFEDSEHRKGRRELRVTRVGTHAVSSGSASNLRGRLRTHAGTAALTGSHRSSIFRLHVGNALLAGSGESVPSWGSGSGRAASKEIQLAEDSTEILVSKRIRDMRVLPLAIDDQSSSKSDRAFIEQNSIGLLSTVGRTFDPPSPEWLGGLSVRSEIRESGLWNLNHLYQEVHPEFLSALTTIRLQGGKVSHAPPNW